MNISVESYQKRIITPIWNSTVRHINTDTQVNLFPARMNHHSRRFYGRSSTTRKTHASTQNSFYLASNNSEPSNTAPRIDNGRSSVPGAKTPSSNSHHNSNRSHTTMTAFCSTSKVKRTPLAGQNTDPFAGLRLGTNHPTIYTPSPRPISRPIVIHGKRFTVVPISKPNINGNSMAYSEENNMMQKSEYSDQRRRFVEAERQHLYSKVYRKSNKENQEPILPRNYCISGLGLNLSRTPKETELTWRDNRKSVLKNPYPLNGYLTQHSQTEQGLVDDQDAVIAAKPECIAQQPTYDSTKKNGDLLTGLVDPDSTETTHNNTNKDNSNFPVTMNGNNADNSDLKLVEDVLQIVATFKFIETELEPHLQNVSEFVLNFYDQNVENLNGASQIEQEASHIWTLLTPNAEEKSATEPVNLDALLTNISVLVSSNEDPVNSTELAQNIDNLTLTEKEPILIKMIFDSLECSHVNKADINNLVECIKLFSRKSSTCEMLLGVLFSLNLLKRLITKHHLNIGHNNKEGQLTIILMMLLDLADQQKYSPELINDQFQMFSLENSQCSSPLLHCLTISMRIRTKLFPSFISIDEFGQLEAAVIQSRSY